MVEKLQDHGGIQFLDLNLTRCVAGFVLNEREEQPESVTISRNRSRTDLLVLSQVLREKRLNHRRQPELRCHSSPPAQAGAWKSVAAAPRSSGVAVMYQ